MPSQAAERVLAIYNTELDRIRVDHAALIADLVMEVALAGDDATSDFFFDASDSTKSHLGMEAANAIEDEDGQEEAISLVEKWVADNVANAGYETNVANVIWSRGVEQAAQSIRSEITATAAPKA